MSNVKGRYRHASFDETLTLLSKSRRSRRATMIHGNMFKGKKKLWEEGEYEKTNSHDDKGYEHKYGRKTPKVSLAPVGFATRRLDGET